MGLKAACLYSPILLGLFLMATEFCWPSKYSSVLELRLAGQPAGSVQPGSAGDGNLTKQLMDRLLSAPPPLHGFQKKVGILPGKLWLNDFGRRRTAAFRGWREACENGTLARQAQPPLLATGCQVVVNHHYKYVWIKSRKTGGTTMREAVGWICSDELLRPKDANLSFCGHLSENDDSLKGADVKSLWMDYFVFTTVRNPYARFASAWMFLRSLNCSHHDFGEVCQTPFEIESECMKSNTFCESDTFYMDHIREQTSCMFTDNGDMAVDFVARTETLSEDFSVIAREVNKRRKNGVPELNLELGKTLNAASSSVAVNHKDIFAQYPYCFRELDKLLENEFIDLQYRRKKTIEKKDNK